MNIVANSNDTQTYNRNSNLMATPTVPGKKRNSRLRSDLNKTKEVNDPLENTPLFIKKTYNMINACDPSIATWSKSGLSFVVKDVDSLTSTIMCRYFKHNNFSSFIRQLNLYGFKKVRTLDTEFTSIATDRIEREKIESKYCQFKHPLFQRGRLDLLSQIRKSKQFPDATDKSEVEKLKMEVKQIRTTISTLSLQMGEVSALVNNLMATYSQKTSVSRHDTVPQRKEYGCIQPTPIRNVLSVKEKEYSKTTSARAAAIELLKRKRDAEYAANGCTDTSALFKRQRVLPVSAEAGFPLSFNDTSTSITPSPSLAGSDVSSSFNSEFGFSLTGEKQFPSTKDYEEESQPSWLDNLF